MKLLDNFIFVFLLLVLKSQIEAQTDKEQWLYQINLVSGEGTIELPDTPYPSRIFFLRFGEHSFEPDSIILERKEKDRWVKIGDKNSILIGSPVSVGLFQELKAVPWSIPVDLFTRRAAYRFKVRRKGGVNGRPGRDMFWDQVIMVKESAISSDNMTRLGNLTLVESGKFGEALPPHVRKIHFSPEEIEKQKECLTDPIMDLLKRSPKREISWKELESKAFPLDYQKMLLSGINDSDPGFVYQNGQWFVTWPGSDGSHILPEWNKKMDIWFIPAIRLGKEIIRPAPLSAKIRFFKNKNERSLPLLIVEWIFQSSDNKEIKIIQSLFSEVLNGIPQLIVHMKMNDPTQRANFVIGHGKRPYAHYWDDLSVRRTPIPFFMSQFNLTKKNDYVLTDEIGSVIMCSSVPIRILHSGISETLLEFDNQNSEIFLSTPQIRTEDLSKAITKKDFKEAFVRFKEKWNGLLSDGACAELPSLEWKEKIDSWLTQICSITKIQNEGNVQLSYGAYFYKAYFGIEEGWAAVALAQWGKSKESKQQAEILLSKENLDKNNYHHQYRNGLSSWYAASIARLTGDKDWLRSISPALVSNGYWTIKARREDEGKRSLISRGLLPSHIYGGDVSTPAYSLYSNATCLKGLIETSSVFKQSELNELQAVADSFCKEALDFKKRLIQVMNEVLDKKSSPVFLPLALELNHTVGNHEGPYGRLTDDKLGNYWNLFAPLFLHLEILKYKNPECRSEWLTDYMENRGGHFAGSPRFYTGLDAVYAIGYISELLERSKMDIENRTKALIALESYMIFASSRNGHTIQEVSGFYPERLDWREYECVVREAPWNFGMYNIDRYLQGYSSFTEPLGAGAGEGLLLIRKSVIDEIRDENGLPDGGVFFLSSIPSEWLKEGKEIKLSRFPTAYGTFDLHIKSYISSKREIHVKYNYSKILGKDRSTGKDLLAWNELNKILIRLVPAYEDCLSGKKLKINQPLTYYDEWTIQLPVMGKGDFIIEF
jgi:hypothetical protein